MPRSPHRLVTDQRGFTMVSVMLGMFVIGLFAVGAWQASVGDIPLARENQSRKQAYQAAQAGLEWYDYQLEKNPAYWTGCASVPAVGGQPAPVNQAWDGSGADPRQWRALVGSDEQYTLEIIPADGQATCSTASPQSTALQDNTLRVRSTGRSQDEKRSIVATYKRKSFLDFIYFTDRETLPPVAYTGTSTSVSWAQSNCDQPRASRPSGCTNIQFAPADVIRGPLHTNDDSLLTCDGATFGRAGDKVEVAGPLPAYVKSCSGDPNFVGTLVAPASTLTLPPSNTTLANLADPNYTFTGQTCLNFTGNSVQVWTNRSWSGTVTCAGSPTFTRSLPAPNGIIYIKNNGSGCTSTYQYYQNYADPSACGTAAISGSYSSSTTVGAANDVIVRDDVTRSGDTMLGLVANNFIRVYHPVTSRSGNSCSENGGPATIQIDAAMLALNESFITDNWYCGSPTGTLTVNGAIAQKWRGAVGTGGASGASTGYIKDYNYDDRLKFKEPPNFLDPVQTSWHIVRRTEQQPAR
jgi:type II secretory pathway pseudopilin PulG